MFFSRPQWRRRRFVECIDVDGWCSSSSCWQVLWMLFTGCNMQSSPTSSKGFIQSRRSRSNGRAWSTWSPIFRLFSPPAGFSRWRCEFPDFNQEDHSSLILLSFGFQGLRVCLVLGSSIMAVGSWIKVFSGTPDRFWVAFIGQTFVAVAQIFTLALPPRLAEVINKKHLHNI